MNIERGGGVSALLRGTPLPRMFRARQAFPRPRIAPGDIPALVAAQLGKPEIARAIKPGGRIAVTAGSRGIANVALITKAAVDALRSMGARPFIVPAMGSHGGASPEGQLEILAGYGIGEGTMGCPIDASMETVEVGVSALGRPVHVARSALEADGVVVACRIKPHNAFRGRWESGPCKMMVVGLGKRAGAESLHAKGMGRIAEHLPASARVVLERAPILCALPCVENAYDETLLIEAIEPALILEREAELLELAFANMPRLLVAEADVLVVDEIGKDYSGTGVDPNVTGTFSTPFASGGLKVQRSCMLGLSAASKGNGLGVGLADVITRRLFDALDGEKMYPNCLTSTVLRSAMIPMVVADDREAIQACLRTLNGVDPASARMVRIPNSLRVGSIMLSEAYVADARAGRWPGLECVDEPRELEFDEEGRISTPIAETGPGR